MAGFLGEKRVWLKENWKPLLAVLLIGLLPFLGFFTSSGQALYASDSLQAPAWKPFLAALKHGLIPMWHPYGLGGMPSLDAGFGDFAYPGFQLIGLIFPIKTFISWCFILHALFAGCAAYYLVRRFFGLDKILSVGLAVAYMFNTDFLSHIYDGHTGKFYILAWLPLSLYFLLRNLSRGAHWRHSLGLALTLSVILSIFHPQLTYFVLMGYFLVWAFKTVLILKDKEYPRAALVAARFWLPILLGIGLVFFLFYPPTQWTKQYGIRGSDEKTTYEHATSWSMHPEETASLVVPEFGGILDKYWGRNPFKLNSEYPGLSVLFLGVLGLVLYRKEKGYWFWLWGGVGILAVIFGLGAHTPLYHLFYAAIPGIKNFRAPSMMLFWLATALLVMSADTLARLTRGPAPSSEVRARRSKRLMQFGFGAAGLLVLVGVVPSIAYGIWDSLFSGEALPNLANRAAGQSAFSLGALRAGVLLAALVFAARKWLIENVEPMRFGLVLLAVTCVDLIWVDSSFIRTYDPERFLASEPAIDFLKADTSAFRVFGLPGAYERWVLQYHGIETTDGWTDNEYRLYREFRGGDYQQNPNFMAGLKQNPDGTVSGSPFLDMLNVKYLAYRLQGEGGLRLAPNTSVLPRAWFVPHWDTLPEDQVLARMLQGGFDPRRSAFLSGSGLGPRPGEASAPSSPAAAAPDSSRRGNAGDTSRAAAPAANAPETPAAALRLERKDFNSASWSVQAPSEGLVVFSELWFPHWQVSVDGKPAPLLRANYAFRGVHVDAGAHTIAFAYHSPWIGKGLKVGLLSLILLIAFLFGLRAFAARLEGPAPKSA